MIEVPSFKVSVPIPSDLLPRDILPPVGQPGSAKATITLKLKADGFVLQAVVKAKSYRETLAKVDSSPHGAYVVLQGKLKGKTEIVEAGFNVQPIVPKDSAPPVCQPPAPPSLVAELSRGYLAIPEESSKMRSLHF
jgi:hypothetical protein